MFDGKRIRKALKRPTVDYHCPIVRLIEVMKKERKEGEQIESITCIDGYVHVKYSTIAVISVVLFAHSAQGFSLLSYSHWP